jgi:SH3 domain protein
MAIKLMEMNLKSLPGYFIPLYFVIAIAIAVFLCIPSTALAKYLYVVAINEVPLRSGKGIEYRVVAVIINGSQVQLLEEDGDWTMVSTSDNKKGWMPKRYLSASPPLKDMAASLQVERDKIKKQTTEISEQLDEVSEARNQFEQELKACILDRDQIRKNYESLQEDAADVLNFKKALSETAEELQEVRHKYAMAEQENEHLRDNRRIKWFLAGAGILVVGWIIGLITTRGHKRRPSLL